MQMNFCSHCGQPVRLVVPEGDNVQRHVCIGCGTVHYQNPKIVAGCVPEYDGAILLCRRAIEPRRGYWTIPDVKAKDENGRDIAELDASRFATTVDGAGVPVQFAPAPAGRYLGFLSLTRPKSFHLKKV